MPILQGLVEKWIFWRKVIKYALQSIIFFGGVEQAPVPCDWTLSYDSFIAEGKAGIAEGDEKKDGMNLLMAHYGMLGTPTYRQGEFNAMKILKFSVIRYTAKRYRGSDCSLGNYNLPNYT